MIDVEVKLQMETERGDQARAILENPLFNEAFETMRANLLSQFENSPAEDKEGREQAWMMLKVINQAKQKFETELDTGKMARMTLDEAKKAKAKR